MSKQIKVIFNDDTPQSVIDLISETITCLTDLANVTAVQFVTDEPDEEEANDA